MAHNHFQLNYDELTSIAKQFKDQGEDIARLHAQTRQRVRDLYKEWEGEAAEKFFDEMETLLLPAVQRLAQALFLTQDTAGEIMKIIREADEDTVGIFRNQLGGGDDFGAGKFGEAVQGLQGGSSGGADDFGAGKFGDVLGAQPQGGGGSAPDDFGAGKFGEAVGSDSTSGDSGHSGGSSSEGGGGGAASDKKPKEKETPEVETEPTSGGGGGGSSSSSQGLQGDLKKMGTGLSDVVGQNASSGGSGGPASMPDHVYSSESSPKPDDAPLPSNQPKPGVDTSSGGGGQPQGGGAATGAAGAAGAAAAGGAAKAVKGKVKKSRG